MICKISIALDFFMRLIRKSFVLVAVVFGILTYCYLRQCDGVFKKYEHELAVCAIFKNEAPYLKEWIDYHHDVLGASRFYLYNNDSSDGYMEVLSPYIERGLVELIDWESTDAHAFDVDAICKYPWDRYQIGAYTDCCQNRALGAVRWLAVHDIDEFVVPPGGVESFKRMLRRASRPSMKKFLKNPFHFVRPIGCLKFHWLLFGTSGVWDLEENQSLTDTLVLRAREGYSSHLDTKCIYRPEAVETCLIHNAYLKKREYRSQHIPYSLCRIHHYFTGPEKRFIEKRKPSTERFEQVSKDFNAVKDRTLIELKNQS